MRRLEVRIGEWGVAVNLYGLPALSSWAGWGISRRSRPELEGALAYSSGAHGGRPPYDPVMVLKVLVIQTVNTLSDERTEFLINDRL